jgi:hypothetical protein
MTGVALRTASTWIPVVRAADVTAEVAASGDAADAGAAATIIAPAAPTDATPAMTKRAILADILIFALP